MPVTHIIVSGYISIPLAEVDAVTEALEKHKKLTRAEPGCLIFNVRPDPEDRSRFKVYEKFVSKQAFEAHQARVKSSEWAKISENVGRHYNLLEKEVI